MATLKLVFTGDATDMALVFSAITAYRLSLSADGETDNPVAVDYDVRIVALLDNAVCGPDVPPMLIGGPFGSGKPDNKPSYTGNPFLREAGTLLRSKGYDYCLCPDGSFDITRDENPDFKKKVKNLSALMGFAQDAPRSAFVERGSAGMRNAEKATPAQKRAAEYKSIRGVLNRKGYYVSRNENRAYEIRRISDMVLVNECEDLDDLRVYAGDAPKLDVMPPPNEPPR